MGAEKSKNKELKGEELMVDSEMQEKVRVPDDVDLRLEGNIIGINGPKGEVSKELDMQGISFREENGTIVIESDSPKRKQRAFLGTARSHIRNMIRAVTEGFTYRLRVVYSHFPISVKAKDDRVEIHNFLGEREPRVAEIVGSTEVEVEGEEVIVRGTDKEEVGQTAANIEQVARVRGRDPRTFQDGIYVIEGA